MTNEMSKGKAGLIAALFAFVLALGLLPSMAFADDLVAGKAAADGATDSINVYVSVSNKGTLALARAEVTVTDIDGDGKYTYDEALQATHEEFCPGGYATKVGEWGLEVTKLWNVEQGPNYLFMKNNKKTNGVGIETVAAGDELIAVVMEDTTTYSDHAGYFEKSVLSGTTADSFELTLMANYINAWPEVDPMVAPDVQIGTWQDGKFTAIEGKKTDEDGKVTLTFDKPGTYVVSAKGTIKDKVTDYTTGEVTTKDCPLSAPVCVVTVDGPMYRLYNPNSGEHFYTGSAYEAASVQKAGWNLESKEAWIAPASSKSPVYRVYNPNAGDHHYTMSEYEKNELVKAGWRDEGIGWYSAGENGVPLYRQYNPNAETGTHNYTASKYENDELVKAGWRAEGIGWYGLASER